MNEPNGTKFEYDIQKRARAGTSATLRAVVAIYIGYLGYRLISGAEQVLFIVAGAAFIAAALGFCVYIWQRYRRDLAAAKLPETDAAETIEETDEEDAPGE